MQVKIDTSERFHVITIPEKTLSANMTEYLMDKLSSVLKENIKNVVLNLKDIENIELAAIQAIINMQMVFAEHNASFVTCCLQPAVKKQVEAADEDELINIVPTQSEAVEIVLMDEIEREMDEN